MSKSWKKWSIIAGIASLAAILLIGGGIVGGILSGVGPAVAQEPPGDGARLGMQQDHGMGMGREGHDGAALEERLQEAVADGRLTQEQADSILECMASGEGHCMQLAEGAFGPRDARGMAIGRAGQDYASREERVQELVADGRLTQEQADEILEHMAECDGDCSDCSSDHGSRTEDGHHGKGRGYRFPGSGQEQGPRLEN